VNTGYDWDFYEQNYSDYEQGSAEPIVKGRLKAAAKFLESINASSFVMDVINEGYKIPFIHTPQRGMFKNNQSALTNKEFVLSAINDLLDKGLIAECSDIPEVVNPLSVSVQSSGKKRLILDLRYVNQYLWKEKV
jgi:hypothetical protein